MELPETDNYAIVIALDPEHEGIHCYAVINKAHEVYEYYDNLLPRTYQAMIQMEEKYKDMEKDISGEAQLELAANPTTDITSH